jgi:hypothetical protein
MVKLKNETYSMVSKARKFGSVSAINRNLAHNDTSMIRCFESSQQM